ncbi:Fur family ferric uptake transcriptional regulator [Gramella sp. Hel_I_59]|uniref:Fur family transcriptional regulator n=1 Tax=Gramella sp. Hel_I_59 TaxID=1249978 RepID=UPI0011549752|nr:transcriptional repressor [Gramella sp. Hel_I_59]TQI71992.1 Fur family ferric uptake transcriptional regulator [Gramella sp. Hel_I_59]
MTKAETTLRNNGIRPTKMRLFIYKYLKRKFYAVTLREIETAFVKKSEHTRDRTTIYRSIKLFQKKGIIHQIDDGTAIAKYAFSVKNSLDLHLHLHCMNCNKTFCLPNKVPQENLPDKYEITEVNLVLKGACANCLKAKKLKYNIDQSAHKKLKQ